MSWAADEWKDGLPPAALQKISQIEAQFERLKKDRDQKQCQLESIEVVSYIILVLQSNATFLYIQLRVKFNIFQ